MSRWRDALSSAANRNVLYTRLKPRSLWLMLAVQVGGVLALGIVLFHFIAGEAWVFAIPESVVLAVVGQVLAFRAFRR
jgi:hypothetical protein